MVRLYLSMSNIRTVLNVLYVILYVNSKYGRENGFCISINNVYCRYVGNAFDSRIQRNRLFVHLQCLPLCLDFYMYIFY